ncbi:MAG: hypothetical protein Q9191_006882, partial [Dirinaria sp. TL-2023a]
MSLNGLDATQVNEAYHFAVNEAGGWLVLKYTSRAEVGLLKKGNGGIQEVREAVAQYDEQSPLFGLIHYRRRKVLLKYVPEGTSRLLQARLAVHFQSVSEKFSATDTVFSFNTPAELADNALSAACALHTSPASIKSASSLRRKGLAEITEDANETQGIIQCEESRDDTSVTLPDAKTSQTRLDTQDDTQSPTPPTEQAPSPSQSPTTIRNSDKALPPIPTSLQEEDKAPASVQWEEQSRTSLEGRQSFQSARPPTREGYDRYDANGFKIKEKVGPRPSLDSTSGVVAADPTSRGYNPRPTSSLPASVHMPLRKLMPVKRGPQASQSLPVQVTSTSAASENAAPSLPTLPLSQPPPPPTPISARPRIANSKTSNMTPEKRRLMKAVELRQKQLAAQKAAQGLAVRTIPVEPAEPAKEKIQLENSVIRSSEDPSAEESLDTLQAAEKEEEMGLVRLSSTDVGKDDTAVVEASPISVPEVSEGPSTQASSVSEEDDTQAQQQQDVTKGATAGPIDLARNVTSPAADTEEQDPGGIEDDAGNDIRSPSNRPISPEPTAADARTQIHDDIATTNSLSTQIPTRLPEEGTGPQQGGDSREGVESAPDDVLRREDQKGATEVENAPKEDQPAIDLGRIQENSATSILSTPQSTGASQSPETAQILKVPPCAVAESVSPQEVPLSPMGENEEAYSRSQPATFFSEPPIQRIPSIETPSLRVDQVTSDPQTGDSTAIHTSASTGMRISTSETFPDRRSSRQNRRHGLVEPIRRVSSGENSDDQSLSDDSFMEELQCATVQEAKPVRVSKSPVMPDFPRSTSEQRPELVRNPRSVSSPLETSMMVDRKTPSPQRASLVPPRSVSVSRPRSVSPSETSPPLLKKVGVSSGISQRIKALETLSSRPTSPSSVLHSPANPPPAYASLGSRKSSFPSRSRPSDRPTSRQSLSPSANGFDLASPKLATPKPYNQFVSVSVASQPGKSRPDSISVTAKIVRDDRNRASPISHDSSVTRAADLHYSPLKVEHLNPDTNPPRLSTKKPQVKRHTTAPSNLSTSPPDYNKRESFLGSSSRRDSIHSASNGSRRGSDTNLSRSASEVSLSGMVSDGGGKEEKKGSRKSRMLKRMSNITSASRRSIATALSPGPAREREQPIAEHPEPAAAVQAVPVAMAAVDMGDVNIQFPDTLSSRITTKRYLLSDFHPPFIPDQDRQEMPHSVTLDFRDGGSTLQCACENSVVQS